MTTPTPEFRQFDGSLGFMLQVLLALVLFLPATSLYAATFNTEVTSVTSIPNNGCGTSYSTITNITIPVTQNYTITDLNLGLNISHAYRADLDVRLTSPDGTSIWLFTDVGTSYDNIDVLLDDSNGTDIGSIGTTNHDVASPYYENLFNPESTAVLASFNGKSSQGNWVLGLCDDSSTNTTIGSVNRIRLDFTGTPNCSTTVTTTSDTDNAGNDSGSLRDAIECANSTAGADTISFNIPTTDSGYTNPDGVASNGDEYWSLQLSSQLPGITEAVTIDGRTQTTNQGNKNSGTVAAATTVGTTSTALAAVNSPEIVLKGYNWITAGFDIRANNVKLYGMGMMTFDTSIRFDQDNITGAIIDGMVLGANPVNGADIWPTTRTNQHIAVDASNVGFTLTNSLLAYTEINRGIVTGQYKTVANVAATINGNHFIGLGKSFTTDNGAIEILRTTSPNIQILGNRFVGVGVMSSDLAVEFNDYGAGNITCTTCLISENDISGFHDAIGYFTDASLSGLVVISNRIHNNTEFGMLLGNVQSSILIQNELYANGKSGILINKNAALNNSITQNSIYNNGQVGINLASTADSAGGMTINDANDADTGPNQLLNFPIISDLSIASGNLTVKGCAPSGAKIELFEADVSPGGAATVGDNRFTMTTDYGEGQRYLTVLTEGSVSDTDSANCALGTDPDGNVSTGMKAFSFTLTTPSGVVLNDLLTATSSITGTGTSEFSPMHTARDGTVLAGTIQGVVYKDTNSNDAYDTATDSGLPSITVKLYDENGTSTNYSDDTLVATTSSSGTGGYIFNNVSATVGKTYRIQVDATDTDLPAGATLGTPNPLKGVTVTNSGITASQNFGFDVVSGCAAPAPSGSSAYINSAIGWLHDQDSPTIGQTANHGFPSISNTSLIASGAYEATSGLSTGLTDWGLYATTASVPSTLATAISSNAYLQYSFTTQSSLSGENILHGAGMAVWGTTIGSNHSGKYKLQIQMADNAAFSSPTIVKNLIQIDESNPTTGSSINEGPYDYGMAYYYNHYDFDIPFALSPGKTYYVRFYLYDQTVSGFIGSTNGRVVFDNLYLKSYTCNQSTIRGTVYTDSNANNTFDNATESGLGSIKVSLYNNATGTLLKTTNTAMDGSYSFSGLDSSLTYKISVDTADTDLPAGASIGTTNPMTAVTVTAGGTTANQNFGFDISAASTRDYGDAPATYGAANHTVVAGIYLGDNAPDTESASKYSFNARADANDDGAPSQNAPGAYIPLFPVLQMTDTSYSSSFKVTNTTGTAGNLYGWIDFDQSGAFEADEAASVTVPTGSSKASVTLNWASIPADIKLGTTIIRLRLSTDGSVTTSTPTGNASNGEVEDFPIAVAMDIPPNSPSVSIVSGATPAACESVVFQDNFDDLAPHLYWGANRADGQPIRDWVRSGGGNDTYARTVDSTSLGYGTSIYFGNGAVRRVSPAITGGFSFDANGKLLTVIDAVELRDDIDDTTPGSTVNSFGSEADWGPQPVTFSRTFATTAGKTYRLYFKAIPEDIGTNTFPKDGAMRLDVPGGSIHFKIPKSSGSTQSYAVEFTAVSSSSTISFVNYGHFESNNSGYCDPNSVYNGNAWCTAGGDADGQQANELIIDDVKLTETACSTGTIHGFVYIDSDRNNVHNLNVEPPVQNVTVSLYDENFTPADTSDDRLVTTATTYNNGEYYFWNINSDRTYRIAVDTTSSNLPAHSAIGTTNPLTGKVVPANSTLDNQDFGFDVFTPSNITGRVYIDSNGNNSFDSATEYGLSSITVSLYDENFTPGSTGDDTLLSTASTTVDGFYYFGNLDHNLTYWVAVDTADTDIPASASIGTTNPFTGIAVAENSSVTKNFGFDLATSGITGKVFLDYNLNGTLDTNTSLNNIASNTSIKLAYDKGVQGAEIRASCVGASGTLTFGPVTSDANGQYYLPTPGAVAGNYNCALQLSKLPAGYTAATQSGSGSQVLTQFVSPTAANTYFALQEEASYCQNNPDMAVNRFAYGQQTPNPPYAGNNDVYNLFAFPYNSGTAGVPNTTPPGYNLPLETDTAFRNLARANQVGSVFGMGWEPASSSLFAAAYMKAWTGFGSGGTGGIYRVDLSNPSSPTSSLYANLNQIFPATPPTAGNDPYLTGVFSAANPGYVRIADGSSAPDGSYVASGDATRDNQDGQIAEAVGKTAFGDLDVSADGKSLFVVNMANNKLYILPVRSAPLTAADADAGLINSYDIPFAANCVAGKLKRVFGLGEYKGGLYVASSCDVDVVPAWFTIEHSVFRFDLTTKTFATTPSLTYQRPSEDTYAINYSTINDIEFDPAGNMMLAFRNSLPSDYGEGVDGHNGSGYSVIRRACLTDNTNHLWTREDNGSCGGVTTAGKDAGYGTGPNYGTFFYQEYPADQGIGLRAASYGGAAQIPGFMETAYTIAEPFDFYGVGISWVDTGIGNPATAGQRNRAYSFYKGTGAFDYPDNRPINGKNAAIGDLEILCDSPSLEIGNRVWQDSNSNGIQDAGEPPISGIKVELFSNSTDITSGTPLATAVTDSNGYYVFSSDMRGYPASGNNAPNDTSGASGGFNAADIQGGRTSTASHKYGLLTLAANTQYKVVIPNADGASKQSALGTLTLTAASQGTDTELDSDANLTGDDAIVTVTMPDDGSHYHAVDFGFFPAVAGSGSITGFVYTDSNANNILDVSETKLPNITVKLYDSSKTTLLQTTSTDTSGAYTFANISTGTYQVEADTADTDLPAGASIGTTNPLSSVVVTSGATTANQNFGFDTSSSACAAPYPTTTGVHSSITWNHNPYTPASQVVGGHPVPAIIDSGLFASAANEVVSNLTVGPTDWEEYTEASTVPATLAQAISGNKYFQYSFTTQASLSTDYILYGVALSTLGPLNTWVHSGTYKMQIQIDDNAAFSSPTVLQNMIQIDEDNPTTGGDVSEGPLYSSDYYINHYDLDTPVTLAENTTYYVRFYLYDVSKTGVANGVAGRIVFDDLILKTYNCGSAPANLLSIADAVVTEGNSGLTYLNFPVQLNMAAPPGGVSFNYATADGTATLTDNDYQSTSGSLTIPMGANGSVISVPVVGDTNVEANETIRLNVTNVVNAQYINGGYPEPPKGVILNDDAVLACNASSGDFGGVVYQDYNQDGLRESGEIGLSGVTVTAYNSSNAVAATATTDADGWYKLTGLTSGSQYRLEFGGLPSGVESGATGTQSSTNVQFVTVNASCSNNLGVSNPVDYCQADPKLLAARFVNGDTSVGSASMTGSFGALLSYNYSASGITPAVNTDALGSQVGSVWGIAYNRQKKKAFATAVVRRHIGLGPLGIGGIYVVDYSGASPVASSFLNVDGLSGIDAGSIGTNAGRGLSGDPYSASYDPTAFDKVGKEGLGDAELSDDGNTLYVANLYSRKIIKIDLTTYNTSGTIPSTATEISLPAVSCTNGVARPFGLKYYRGKLYAGITCTGESGGTSADLKASIQAYDGSSWTEKLQVPLNYQTWHADHMRASEYSRANIPWVSSMSQLTLGDHGSMDWADDSQLLLSGIEFDTNGDMLLGFIDRTGLQFGQNNYGTDTSSSRFYGVFSNGELLKAGYNASTGIYTLENAGTAGGVNGEGVKTGTDPAWPYGGPGGGEFYGGERFTGHTENSYGAIALVPGKQELALNAMNPFNITTGGTLWLDNNTGRRTRGAQLYGDDNRFFGKAIGLGDLEVLCDTAPIEVGNRVWLDADSDGLQDAGESGINNVTVTLACGTDSVTATTNAAGEYYFSNKTSGNATFMDAGESCTLKVNSSQASLSAYSLTTQNADSKTDNNRFTDIRDSDAMNNAGTAEISFTVGATGQNNHGLDFGYQAAAVSAVPLTCNGTLYQVHSTTGQIVNVDLYQQTLTPLANSAGYEVNGVGWRAADNLAYGIKRYTTDVIAIDATGTAFNLGATTGLPAPVSGYYAGDFGPGGYLYVRDVDLSTVYKVDVTTRQVVGSITLSPNLPDAGDIAYDATTNLFYTVATTSVYAFDPTSGATSLIGPHNTGDNALYWGALYVDSNGTLIGISNDTGKVYTFDKNTGAGELIGSATPAAYNDGFMCPGAPVVINRDHTDLPADGSALPNGAAGTTAYGDALHTITSSTYLGSSVDDDPFSIASNDATGDGSDDDGVFYGTVAGAVSLQNQTLTVGTAKTLEVSISGTGGYLQAWFDWNGDGDFADSGEQVATNMQDSDSDGIIPLSVTPPANAFGGTTFARFRWSTTTGLDATAPANDGEVEDYALTIQAPACTAPVLTSDTIRADASIAWTHNLNNPAGASANHALPSIYNSGLITSAANEAMGGFTSSNTGRGDDIFYMTSSAVPATQSDSMYVQYSFTTQPTLSENHYLYGIGMATYQYDVTRWNYSGAYKVQVKIADNAAFSSPTILKATPIQIDQNNPTVGGTVTSSLSQYYFNHYNFDSVYTLQPNKTYYVRVYPYNVTGDGKGDGVTGRVLLDDVHLKTYNCGTGNITGKVYTDDNGNNSYDAATEAGISSVTVTLKNNATGTVISTVNTVIDGSYSFTGLDPSLTYRIEVDTADADLAGKTIGTTNPLTNISVAAGGTTTQQDFGFDPITQPPFSCAADIYLTAGNPAAMFTLDVNTKPVTETLFVADTAIPYNRVNATAYNTADNYIYTIRRTTPFNLMRIGADGSVVELGAITGIDASTSIVAGDFNGATGKLIINTASPDNLYAVDIATRTATLLQTNINVGADLAWNPVDGLLYAVLSTNKVVSVDISSATPVVSELFSMPAGGTYGATFFDNSGRFYALLNDTQTLYAVDLATGKATAIGTGIGASDDNDGASCPGLALADLGSIKGTVYTDNNRSDTYDSGTEAGLGAITVNLYFDNSTPGDFSDDVLAGSRETDSNGSYLFQNVNAGAGITYRIEVNTSDTDLPSGATIGTINPLTGVTVTAGSTKDNQNFGFDVNCSLVVTSTADTNSSYNNSGSLRDAIECANSTPATDTITFNIPTSQPGYTNPDGIASNGDEYWSIKPTSALPGITQPLVLDASTQPGTTCPKPRVEIDGSSAGANIDGIGVYASNSTVKGLIVNNFSRYGILLSRFPINFPVSNTLQTNNSVECSYIGVSASGLVAKPNTLGGIAAEGDSMTIGGTTAAKRNIISGNGAFGIYFQGGGSTNGTVQGNYIGVGTDGTTALGNSGFGIGYYNTDGGGLIGGTTGTTINGACTGACNIIAHNTSAGVGSFYTGPAAINVRISANSIHSNGGIGIDLERSSSPWVLDGVNPNDAKDTDSQFAPNGLQNYPVLTSAILTGSNTSVSGTLNSNVSTTFTLEFFADTSADPTGYGEGKTYLGNTTVTTDVNGDASFTVSLPTVASGTYITATATNATNNTSEFSTAITTSTAKDLSGKVFEDVNYGGGAGRALTTSGTAVVAGVRVELYGSAGAFVTSATTAADGSYTFSNLIPGNYYVRIANATVRSTRAGSNGTELGVQTYRTNGTTANASEVGGRNPAVADAASNTTSQTLNTSTFLLSGGGQAQSVQTVTVGSSNISGVDFGFNFSTVVNARDNGQGSLRQFLINSNLLGGDASLAQAGRTAGKENAILELSTSDPKFNAANQYWSIAVETPLPDIGDNVILDGSTQTAQAGFTFANRPVIELDGTIVKSLGLWTNGLILAGTNGGSTVKYFAINRFDNAGIKIRSSKNNTVSYNYIGTDPLHSATTIGNGTHGIEIVSATDFNLVSDNLIAYNKGHGILAWNFNGGGTEKAASISQNSIYANGGLGINLAAGDPNEEITRNDANDSDSGANGLLNMPILNQLVISDGNATVRGCAPAGAVLEFFEADVSPGGAATAGDNKFGLSMDYGEGQTYLGSLVEGGAADTDNGNCAIPAFDGHDNAGMKAFQFSVPSPATLVEGDYLTATATIATTGTSEFGPSVKAISGPPPVGSGSCAATGGSDILFIVDNSGSITPAEYADFSATIQSVGAQLLADNPANRIAVMHFGGPTDSLVSGGQYVYIERDFSNAAMTAPVRQFGTNGAYNVDWWADHLAGAVQQVRYVLDGDAATTSSYIVSPIKETARNTAAPLQIVLMTDAVRYGDWVPSDISMLIDPAGSGAEPDDGSSFTIYNQLKAEGVSFSVVSFNPASADIQASAAIASVGGTYTGVVEANPKDPEGSQTTPRRFISVTSGFQLTAAQIEDIVEGTAICSSSIAGTVFEDVNYGGSNGRAFGTTGTVGVAGATVEVYDNVGAYVASTTTGANGSYKLPNLPDANYFVRVVSDTVNSSRTGSNGAEVPVLTYRSNGTTAVTNQVGGKNPYAADAGSNAGISAMNTTTYVFSGGALAGKQAQAVQPISLTGSSVKNADFGFNFSTIVNANDAGQGSLRQFLLNANLLGNDAALAQTGRTAGVENAILMLTTSDPHYDAGGFWNIALQSQLPSINSQLVLDGTAQTGFTSTPVLHLDGSSAGAVSGLTFATGSNNSQVKALAIKDFGASGILLNGTANTRIGGINAGDGNVITGNTGDGIAVIGNTTLGNSFLGNSIHDNGGLGIDLANDGVTANDAGDGDSGPNSLLNFPSVQTNSFSSNGTRVVTYDMDIDVPAGNYRLEFFVNTAPDASGNGEGETYIGSKNIVHYGVGSANYKGIFNANQTVASGAYISSTITFISNAGEFGSTSEFSGTEDSIPVTVCSSLASGSGGDMIIIDENSTTITQLEAKDASGNPITYVISGGVDSSLFTVVGATNTTTINCSSVQFIGGGTVITKAASADAETRAIVPPGYLPPPGNFELPMDANKDNVYEFQVKAIYQDGTTYTRDMSVRVADVNEAPVITSAAAISYTEDTTVSVVDLAAQDPDAGTSEGNGLTYSISSGTDAAFFSVAPDTGLLTFRAVPDYDAPTDADRNNAYEVEVTVTDAGGLSGSKALTVTIVNNPADDGVLLKARALLQGPYNSTTGLMNADLNSLGLLPVKQPYDAAPFSYSGTESMSALVQESTGNNTVVDWALVELRSSISTTVARRAVMLQRDGDLVDAQTGSTDLHFAGVAAGNYYVSVRHRNHLDVITTNPVALSSTAKMVDFGLKATTVRGTQTRLESGSLALLWAGDTNGSQTLTSSGPGNDVTAILGSIISDTSNPTANTNFTLRGYLATDLNLDGKTLFTGPGNDASLLVGNIILYPLNTDFAGNYIVKGSLAQ